MPERLPVFINPEKVTARGLKTSGELYLEKMDRLIDRLVAPFGKVQVVLEFSKSGRRMMMQGHIDGTMYVECQRCMQAVEFNVNHDFELGFVKNEAEIDNLLPGQEPLFIGQEDIRLADVVEDELTLLLPISIMHEPQACFENNEYGLEKQVINKDRVVVETPVKKNPFAVLADLKK